MGGSDGGRFQESDVARSLGDGSDGGESRGIEQSEDGRHDKNDSCS